jgi:diguanylate cyclase (GGDEF)-like protein/PAS domain S-box-containing protein
MPEALLVILAACAGAGAGWALRNWQFVARLRARPPAYEATVSSSHDALLAVSRDGTLKLASALANRWLGEGGALSPGQMLAPLFEAEFADSLQQMLDESWDAPGYSQVLDMRPVNVLNGPLWIEARVLKLNQDDKHVMVWLRDVTLRRAELTALREEHSIFRTVFDAVPMSMSIEDLYGRFVRSNVENLRRLALPDEEALLGKTVRDVVREELAVQSEEDTRFVIRTARTQTSAAHTHLTGPDDHRWFETIRVPLFDRSQKISGILSITNDITERRESEQKLAEQAACDALTGLPNRRALMERLSAKFDQVREAREALAVLFCDLDFFKTINDMHGHEFGDQLLRALAHSISGQMRLSDWIARFGGDEFVIVCHPLAGDIEGYRIASEILQAVRKPVAVNGVTIQVDASIGVAFLRPEHASASDLIRDADAAMYMAKEQGRNRVAMFDDRLRVRALKRSSLDQALRHAIEHDELSLVYQPKIRLSDGKLVGFEALMRWNSEQHGFVSPSSFIPLAEESGVILAIGRWALESSCAQLRRWQQAFPTQDNLTLAVNVSMRQLFQEGFLQMAREIVDSASIYPNALELEITESTAMSNPQLAVSVLAQLKSMGLRMALDDFGTGYSSLAHLQKLPIDVIKIDRAFVNGVSHSRENAEIARLVVAMAKSLDITTVAEGIETREDLVTIKQIGADIAQGYLFSKPVTRQEADDLLMMSASFLVQ